MPRRVEGGPLDTVGWSVILSDQAGFVKAFLKKTSKTGDGSAFFRAGISVSPLDNPQKFGYNIVVLWISQKKEREIVYDKTAC